MRSLLLTTTPRQDETFTSFLLRTCQENEYESLTWISSLIGIDIRQLAKPNPNKFNLEPLAKLLRIDESLLWNLTFHNDIKFFESNGGPCSFKDHANTEYDKICPSCFNGESYVKKLWNLKINMGCPDHSLLLINICPKCNKKISSIRSDINKCNCGFKLNQLPKIHLNDGEVIHSKIIANAYYGKQLYVVPDKSPISQLSYYSLTKLIHSFWYRLNDGRNGIGINQLKTEKQAVFAQLISVYNIFLNWPANFVDILNKSENEKFITNIKRDFYTKLKDPEFIVFIEEFKSYLERELKRPVVFKSLNVKSNIVSYGNVVKLLNMGQQSINNLIENGILVEHNKKHNHQFSRRSITVDSINNFLEMKKYIVFKKELANSLGLGTKYINQFEEAGWIRRIEIFSKKNDKKSYYDIRFKDELVSKLEKNIINIAEENCKKQSFTSFSRLLNLAVARGITFIELVEDIIKGSINIYKLAGEPHFRSYYFESEEALLYIKIIRFEKFIKKDISLFYKEVSELLRLSSQQLKSWKSSGFLGGANSKTFAYDEVEGFLENYISLTEIIIISKVSSVNMVNSLRKKGTNPVNGYGEKKVIEYLFDRNDINILNLGIPRINLCERTKEIISLEKSKIKLRRNDFKVN